MRTESTRPAAAQSTMTAVVQDRYGQADEVLHLAQIARPTCGDAEVLVRVHAAGVDRGVWHLMAGLPYPVRLAGYGVRAPKNPVPGMALAGTVAAVGKDVTDFALGDEVFGVGAGSFAEYATASPSALTHKPAGLDFAHAAAVPVSATTALQAVRDHAKVQPGQRVLVLGASGGVGSFAVQIAKAYGAHVTGLSSTGKLDLVRSLGADVVLDYTVDAIGGAYDVILDVGGNTPLRRLRRALTRRGTLVIVGGETDGRLLGGADRQLRAMVLSPFLRQKLGTFVGKDTAEDLAVLAGMIRSGAVTPAVERTFPLEEATAAITHVHSGRARGKVVLDLTG